MMPSRTFLSLLLALPLGAHAHAHADEPAAHELKVTLFGQPCILSGPLEESALRLLHTISPEQMPPAQTAPEARRLFAKLKDAKGVPALLDKYRERLHRRLAAQVDFFDALDEAEKNKKAAPLLHLAETHFVVKGKHPAFETLARKVESKKAGEWSTETRGQLLDAYNDSIEPDPEEDFHRAIRAAKIRYACSFEAEGGSKGD